MVEAPGPTLIIEEPTPGALALVGELDFASAAELDNRLKDLITAGATEITIDTTDLAFCDSTGLSVLVEANRRLPEQHGLSVRNPRLQLRRLLAATGLIASCGHRPDRHFDPLIRD